MEERTLVPGATASGLMAKEPLPPHPEGPRLLELLKDKSGVPP